MKQPAIWFSKEGNTSGNTIYKQTYTCGEGVDYKNIYQLLRLNKVRLQMIVLANTPNQIAIINVYLMYKPHADE